MDSIPPLHTIPRRPVVVGVPSTRPPSFATYPPSVYPQSVQYGPQPLERPLELQRPPPLLAVASSPLGPAIETSFPIAPLQRIIPYSPAWHTTKIILRSLLFLFALVVVALCALTAVRFPTDYSDDRGVQAWDAVLPVVVVLDTYDLVELFTFCIRWRIKRGMHPGVTVAGDLICCLACGLALTFNIHNATAQRLRAMLWCVEGLLALLFAGHFVLFVRACIETKQRNQSKDDSTVAYVYSPAGGKPFPILGKDLIERERASEAGWTAVTGETTAASPESLQHEQHQQYAGHVAFPPSLVTVSGLGHQAYGSSLPPPPSPSTAPPSVYWQNMAGSGNGFEGYRGPAPAESEACETATVGGSSSTPPLPKDTNDAPRSPNKNRTPNQKEIIPPEIMAEYYGRIQSTPTESSYGHDRIGGSSQYPPDKPKGSEAP
ncbi:hypothetical protein QBC43DRAFT_308594 [Cladorrhinum sp. PSN259]|nr:hypothetical protein QBC43DRAFT_308594 [Cladorrhinum sp. PSN259]